MTDDSRSLADAYAADENRSPFDRLRRVDRSGEFWTGRDLMGPLGYEQWRRFEETIERSKAACVNSGHNVDDAFVQFTQFASAGNLGNQERRDYRLSRYGAYLVAMNGDPRKPEIAAAQSYFAVKTREAELASSQPSTPTSYLEALKALVASEEAKELAAARIAALEPSAAAWDHLGSGGGDWCVADAAKILDRDPNIRIGRDRLFTVLSEHGWIFRDRGDRCWRPYQSAVDAGRLLELPRSHYHPHTGDVVLDAPQVRVTPKGLAALHRRLGGAAPLSVPEQLALGGGEEGSS